VGVDAFHVADFVAEIGLEERRPIDDGTRNYGGKRDAADADADPAASRSPP